MAPLLLRSLHSRVMGSRRLSRRALALWSAYSSTLSSSLSRLSLSPRLPLVPVVLTVLSLALLLCYLCLTSSPPLRSEPLDGVGGIDEGGALDLLFTSDVRFNQSADALPASPLPPYSLTVSPLDPLRSALQLLVRWLLDNGATFPSVYLQHYSSHNHGVHALEPIPASEPVLSIPSSLLLTLDVATSTPFGRRLQRSMGNTTTPYPLIAAYLLIEQADPHSRWSPWLAVVPRSFPSLPICYGPSQWRLLQGSAVAAVVSEQRERFESEFAAITQAAPDFTFSFDAYRSARLLVSTRLFSYTDSRGQRAVALVPLADLLNHATWPRSNVEWAFDAGEDRFVMTTTADVQWHQALHTSYGGHCNSVLLARYGLVLSVNEHNRAALTFRDVDPSAAPRIFTVLPALGDVSTRLMLLHVRRLALAQLSSTLQRRTNRARQVAQRRQPASPQDSGLEEEEEEEHGVRVAGADVRVIVERTVARMIAEAVREAEGRFTESLEEDEERLREWGEGRGSSDEWNCVALRAGEKRVLRWWSLHTHGEGRGSAAV